MSQNHSPLPGQPYIARDGDTLKVEQLSLEALAREHGTPLFVYSKQWMLDALAAYQRGFEGRDALICYAMKANSSLGILRVFAQAGCGFDIVSGGELARVLAVGADPARIIFSGVGKTRAEMRQALAAGIGCFNVESEEELDVLSEVAAARPARPCKHPHQPQRRSEDTPLHLDGPEGQQVRHCARPRAARLSPCCLSAGTAGSGHRLPHRLADH